VTFSISFVNC